MRARKVFIYAMPVRGNPLWAAAIFKIMGVYEPVCAKKV